MGYKSRSNRDHYDGPWGWECTDMGHTKRRNEQRRNERAYLVQDFAEVERVVDKLCRKAA